MAVTSEARHGDDFSDEKAGDHHVLWYRTDRGRAKAVARFLRPAIGRGDLLAIVLPLRELQVTERGLIHEKFPLDKLMSEGRLMLFASEELLPGSDGDHTKVRTAIALLHRKAKAQGRRLSLVGRVAPILFERGDVEGAIAVEVAADSSLGQARLLCLYDARMRQKLPSCNGKRIDDLHTQSFDETPSGGVRVRTNRRKELQKGHAKAKKE